jgi:periplasmic divalent cation tolerance protein
MSSQPADTVVCLITAPQADASRLASLIITKKLAACVNIVPLVQSVYWWEGKVEQDDEALLLLKTVRPAVKGLNEMLDNEHPYDTFELVALDIVAGSNPYIDWITKSVDRT